MSDIDDKLFKSDLEKTCDRKRHNLCIICYPARAHKLYAYLRKFSCPDALRKTEHLASVTKLIFTLRYLCRNDTGNRHRHIRTENEQAAVVIRKFEQLVHIDLACSSRIKISVLEHGSIYLVVTVARIAIEKLSFDFVFGVTLTGQYVADALRLSEFFGHDSPSAL